MKHDDEMRINEIKKANELSEKREINEIRKRKVKIKIKLSYRRFEDDEERSRHVKKQKKDKRDTM